MGASMSWQAGLAGVSVRPARLVFRTPEAAPIAAGRLRLQLALDARHLPASRARGLQTRKAFLWSFPLLPVTPSCANFERRMPADGGDVPSDRASSAALVVRGVPETGQDLVGAQRSMGWTTPQATRAPVSRACSTHSRAPDARRR